VLAAKAGARVFSFEPLPANLTALERNVRLNGLGNVLIFNTAISGKREKRLLFIPNNLAHSARHSLNPGRGAQTQEVSCISLDGILLENNLECIDLLKIDCEGGEYEASAETLARTRTIIVECHGVCEKLTDWSIAGMQAYLQKVGFNIRTRGRIVHAERNV